MYVEEGHPHCYQNSLTFCEPNAAHRQAVALNEADENRAEQYLVTLYKRAMGDGKRNLYVERIMGRAAKL